MSFYFMKTPGERRFTYRWMKTKRSQFLLDVIALVSAFGLAYLLRFDFSLTGGPLGNAIRQMLYIVAAELALLHLFGVNTFIWRYVGMAEIEAFSSAAFCSAFISIFLRLILPESLDAWRVPLSVTVMNTTMGFGSILGMRVLRRIVYERFEKRKDTAQATAGERKSVLLVGAGRAGVMTIKEIQGCGDMVLDVKGFIDDDPMKQGAVIAGVSVLGTTEDLPRLVTQLEIDHVILSLVRAPRADFRRILDICERISVKIRIIPGLSEILQGKVKVSRIRDAQIEDMLGREPVHLDEEEIKDFIFGKTVLVTGAGGSIGSELARQVARFQPSNLLLVERCENALFEIHRELQKTHPDIYSCPVVADINDETRMEWILSTYRPQVILHAAAHKHVPMMEYNSTEAVKNNILATNLLGDLAGKFGAEVCVLISTDKAVRPSSVMGASKRVAELVLQDLNQKYETRYVAVRFGNVIGSAGSVIPIFREQIRNGGPVTVTHPDMVRYFMTIPEASQLVLQAGAIGIGGEIFTLDMGDPVRILDLAKEAITLSGLKPFQDIEIEFTGVRPGEKLFEELELKEENMSRTRHPKIFIGRIAAYPSSEVQRALRKFAYLVASHNEQGVRQFLNDFLPEARLQVEARSMPAPIPERPQQRYTTASRM